jgi:hypothetical protein
MTVSTSTLPSSVLSCTSRHRLSRLSSTKSNWPPAHALATFAAAHSLALSVKQGPPLPNTIPQGWGTRRKEKSNPAPLKNHKDAASKIVPPSICRPPAVFLYFGNSIDSNHRPVCPRFQIKSRNGSKGYIPSSHERLRWCLGPDESMDFGTP